MKFGSICSGIEAASVAWNPLGWEAQFFAEIEPFPCALLKHYYPEVPNYGDLNNFQEWPERDIDLLAGGPPCQAFSVAGLRGGMADPRGNLSLVYLGAVAKYRPRWVLYENVPGLLSSNEGRDFGALLGALGKLGYGYAWRTLDAQHFGVPQRRRRIFLVGYLGDWRPAAAVLFERESLSGHPQKGRKKREGIAGTLGARTQGGGGLGTDFDCDGGVTIGKALTAHGARLDSETETFIAHSLRAQAQASHRADSETYIAHSLRANGHDASEDGTGRGAPLIAFSQKDHGQDAGETAPTLRAMGYNGSHANGGGQVAVAFQSRASHHNGMSVTETVPTLDKSKGEGMCVAFNMHKSGDDRSSMGVAEDRTDALRAFDKAQFAIKPASGATVRRITPLEAELLQGFPPNYTLIRTKAAKKIEQDYREYLQRHRPELSPEELTRLAKDGPRYKAIGNSWAIPCVRWIGERIQQVENLLHDQR